MAATSPAARKFRCIYCNEQFEDEADLRAHKASKYAELSNMSDAEFLAVKDLAIHLYCDDCDFDYRSASGFIRHLRLRHAPRQKISCPGCQSTFSSPGQMIDHIERGRCRTITNEMLTKRRQDKAQFTRQLEVMKEKGDGRGTQKAPLNYIDRCLFMDDEPTPSNTQSAEPQWTPTAGPALEWTSATRTQPEEDDARHFSFQESCQGPSSAFDLPTQAADMESHNSWDYLQNNSQATAQASTPEARCSVHQETQRGFLSAFGVPTRAADLKPYNSWGSLQTADRAPSQASTTQWSRQQALDSTSSVNASSTQSQTAPQSAYVQRLLRQPSETNTSAPVSPNPAATKPPVVVTHDPNQPGFDVNRYYVPSTDMYKCPYENCGKNLKTRNGLVSHLQSANHAAGASMRASCPACGRSFKSAAALTQHAESSGRRCGMRHSDNFRAFFDQLTGGLADAEGQNGDGSYRFVVPENALDGFGLVDKDKKKKKKTEAKSFDDEVDQTQMFWERVDW